MSIILCDRFLVPDSSKAISCAVKKAFSRSPSGASPMMASCPTGAFFRYSITSLELDFFNSIKAIVAL
jgi:hypothetical protein